MFKVFKLSRRFASLLVGAQLSLAAVGAAACLPVNVARAAEFVGAHSAWRGAWRGVTMTVQGRQLYGVETEMENGGIAAFLVDGETISLLLADDQWTLRTDSVTKIAIDVDGQRYFGSGSAKGRNTIVAENVNIGLMKALVAGETARLDIGGVGWTLNLEGFTASFSDALKAADVSF